MSLKDYETKRDFSKSPEPGPSEEVESGSRFVVQEHHASHLHWDFRLELPDQIESNQIVLKSWAVPKGVPEQEGDKKLAVAVEDHPVSYIDFEGTIPEGSYGAGDVRIWDKGTFELLRRDENVIEFILSGQKANGRYTLIKTKGYGKGNTWLLTKNKPKA